MSKFLAIKEQLRVEVDEKYQGNIDVALRDIQSRGLQDDFTDAYINLQKAGFHPYECLTGYMKGQR